MSATPSLLQLETYFLKEISYSLKDGLEKIPGKTDADIKPVNLEISDVTTPYPEMENGWRCELIIKSVDDDEGNNPFYTFKIVMVGFFKVNNSLSTETAKILVESNSPAVLYSTSREIVATLTRRSPFPTVLLPLVTFVRSTVKPKKRTPKKSVSN